jgi:hypothetical protein
MKVSNLSTDSDDSRTQILSLRNFSTIDCATSHPPDGRYAGRTMSPRGWRYRPSDSRPAPHLRDLGDVARRGKSQRARVARDRRIIVRHDWLDPALAVAVRGDGECENATARALRRWQRGGNPKTLTKGLLT